MKRTATPVRYPGGLCLAPGLPWLGLRPGQRGLGFSAAVTYTECLFRTLRNKPKARGKAAPKESQDKPTSPVLSEEFRALPSSALAVIAVTSRTLHRGRALHQSSQHLSPGSCAARSHSAHPHKCHRHMEYTDSFHSNSILHSPQGRADRGSPWGARLSR